jgi:RNA polymerase sigma factor (sigma-70 family)
MLVVIASSMSRKLHDHCSPEDIWQETLAHAWRDRAQHRWKDDGAFRAWVFEIARNRIREAARNLSTEKRGAGRPADRFTDLRPTPSGTVSHLLPADSVTPSRILRRGERKDAVDKALAELPPELAEIVRLHVVEEMTMEAIAERLGIGLSAAWRRYRKGSEIYARTLPRWTGDASSSGS